MIISNHSGPAHQGRPLMSVLILIGLALIATTMRAPAAAPVKHPTTGTDVRLEMGAVSLHVAIA